MTQWINNNGNSILKLDWGYISYCADPSGGFPWFSGDDNMDETALCKDGQFFILNGDFRKEYEELGPKGFSVCWEFFSRHQDAASSWSEKELRK